MLVSSAFVKSDDGVVERFVLYRPSREATASNAELKSLEPPTKKLYNPIKSENSDHHATVKKESSSHSKKVNTNMNMNAISSSFIDAAHNRMSIPTNTTNQFDTNFSDYRTLPIQTVSTMSSLTKRFGYAKMVSDHLNTIADCSTKTYPNQLTTQGGGVSNSMAIPQHNNGLYLNDQNRKSIDDFRKFISQSTSINFTNGNSGGGYWKPTMEELTAAGLLPSPSPLLSSGSVEESSSSNMNSSTLGGVGDINDGDYKNELCNTDIDKHCTNLLSDDPPYGYEEAMDLLSENL